MEDVVLEGVALEETEGDKALQAFTSCFGRAFTRFTLFSVTDVSSLKKRSCLWVYPKQSRFATWLGQHVRCLRAMRCVFQEPSRDFKEFV